MNARSLLLASLLCFWGAATADAQIVVRYDPIQAIGQAAASTPAYYPPTYYQPRYYSYSGPVYVRPHYRIDGAYIPGHYRTVNDGNFSNNWSSYPNINPYNGQWGTQYYRRR